jgi:outer membrane beta-barrel protein
MHRSLAGTRIYRAAFCLAAALPMVMAVTTGSQAMASDSAATSATSSSQQPQEPAPAPAPADPAPEPAPPPEDTTPVGPAEGAANLEEGVTRQTAPTTPGAAAQRSWQDVVVVPRKAFLKGGRLELFPFSGVSLNDVLIRHYAFGGNLNYYLTDVFSIGLEGQYYIKERTDRESIVGLQYNRIATLNRYLYSGSLNFGYVPGYGKFTLFNRYIIHWDLWVQGGVGIIQTEIIPRVVGDATFKNNRIAPSLGLGTHLFLSNWLTFNVAVKDYVFNDLFEPTNRMPGEDINTVKGRATGQFVHNIMLYAGLGLYLPTSFTYRTPR